VRQPKTVNGRPSAKVADLEAVFLVEGQALTNSRQRFEARPSKPAFAIHARFFRSSAASVAAAW